ncbi:MAG: bifunctional phosphoribosylaminoimidazolecarboxamide formyltransferase/IMP cyclohydrolase [Bacteriovoracaceae bacterium]|jgi:phosphoribosylaminoimidazolecarboxamide formyltransferase / IMP cyclohydrolase|nr:bifunctional phosphoribosylaminoimidazolecarboxamide formyltransferase/IMP cyclohydrolase [Bacteriovoracaceae bacterium]
MNLKIKRALLSVSDKTQLLDLAERLAGRGVELIATGGTYQKIFEAGFPVTKVEEITHTPELFDGRIKTLSFNLMGGLLFDRKNSEHVSQAATHGIGAIDMIVVNLYPFEEKLKSKKTWDILIENIDIGGPTMIRASAKNYKNVAVLTNPAQYQGFLEEFDKNGAVSVQSRFEWAKQAFMMTAKYDGLIANTWQDQNTTDCEKAREINFLALENISKLRYGENPHQNAHWKKDALDVTAGSRGFSNAKILQGKPLSYNNLLDMEVAYKTSCELEKLMENEGSCSGNFGAVIVKHLTPCGLALGKSQLEALEWAWSGDPTSSFGSIIALSGSVEEDTATWLSKKFIEIIIAPDFSNKAIEILGAKKNLRLIKQPMSTFTDTEEIRSIGSGEYLVQDPDWDHDREFKSVTKCKFPAELHTMAKFGTLTTKYLKSNAVSVVGIGPHGLPMLLSAGMGQPNRLEAISYLLGPRLLAKDFVDYNKCVVVSDAFFPFADSIESLDQLNLKYIVQPGGSIKDSEVIGACDELGLSMVLTGRRHFKH